MCILCEMCELLGFFELFAIKVGGYVLEGYLGR